MTMTDDAPEPPAQAEMYDSASIEVLTAVEAVRKRPAMYIGDTRDGSGLHHLVRILVENALDEHLAGHCTRLTVTLHAGGAVTVEDDGRGIPIDPVPTTEGMTPALELVLTRYHGRSLVFVVGLTGVNAVCEELVVEVQRDGRLYRQHYRRGTPVAPLADLGPAEGRGTRITIHPDPLIFESTAFDARRIAEMLRPIGFLHPGLRIELVNERRGGYREVWFGRNIASWVDALVEGQDGLPASTLRVRGSGDDLTVDVALRWTRSTSTRIRTFANHHEVTSAALSQGLARGVKRAARRVYPDAAAMPWRPKQLARGLVAIVDARGASLEIVGCCGEGLAADGTRAVRDVIARRMAETLASERTLLRELCALASES